jgi:hypothetical protein
VLIADGMGHHTGQNRTEPRHQFRITVASKVIRSLMSLKHRLLDDVRRIQSSTEVCWQLRSCKEPQVVSITLELLLADFHQSRSDDGQKQNCRE